MNLPDIDFCRAQGWVSVTPPPSAPFGYSQTGRPRKNRVGQLSATEYTRQWRARNLAAGLTAHGTPRKRIQPAQNLPA